MVSEGPDPPVGRRLSKGRMVPARWRRLGRTRSVPSERQRACTRHHLAARGIQPSKMAVAVSRQAPSGDADQRQPRTEHDWPTRRQDAPSGLGRTQGKAFARWNIAGHSRRVLGALAHGAGNLAVRFELAEGIHGPDGGRYPADEGDLQEKADKSCDGAADGEKGQPRQEKRDQKPHENLRTGPEYSTGPSIGPGEIVPLAFRPRRPIVTRKAAAPQ